jgi:Protein of unknown function (DUF3768)
MTTIETTQRIKELNDAFRRTGEGGRILFTAGVSDLGVIFSHQALALVRRFDAFTQGNDPHGEHDFGSFTHQGHKLFWKIDYYDAVCKYGSEDPADLTKTTRVLTIMLAEEY